MGRIKDYQLDATISGSDTFLGNDGDNSGKTKLFKIDNLVAYILANAGGDLGSFKFTLLEFTAAQQAIFPSHVDYINNRGINTSLVANEVLIVYSSTATVDTAWMFLKSNGVYGGTTGTPVISADFIKIHEKFTDVQNAKLNAAFPTIGIPTTTGYFQSNFNSGILTLASTQSDWAVTDNTNVAFIKNKPTISGTGGVQADWSTIDNLAGSYIKNKPTLTSAFTNNGSAGTPYATTTDVNAKENTGVAQTLVNAHANNLSNPHAVTPAQLGLATVATTGSYNSLTDKPTIPTAFAIRTQTLPYTLVNADKGKVLLISNSGTLTVPSGLTGDFEVGIIQTVATTSVISIAGSGVTVNKPDGMTANIYGQNSQVYIVGSGTTFYLFGDLKKV